MKFNTPLPQPLPKECAKASKIFSSFVDSRNNGLDGVIPRSVLENARGFAIFTIFKAGFVFSARAGSGIVIAKLDDGTWSAPSAIGTAGLGVGGQAGAEMTDFLVVLNSRSAVKSFMSAGSLTLGGNLSIAVGPLGRNGEAIGSVSSSGKVAAMYSYSKTKGLFGGISLEGSVIVERQDANATAYRSDVSVKQLLSGAIEPPEWAASLIKTIETCTGFPGTREWIDDRTRESTAYAFEGLNSSGTERSSALLSKKKKKMADLPPPTWGQGKEYGSYLDSDNSFPAHNSLEDLDRLTPQATSQFETQFESDFSPMNKQAQRLSRLSISHTRSSPPLNDTYEPDSPFNSLPPFPKPVIHSRSVSMPTSAAQRNNRLSGYHGDPFDSPIPSDEEFSAYKDKPKSSQSSPRFKKRPELATPLSPKEGVARAIALFNFTAVEPGDLSFSKGDVIVITRKSNKTDDWWKGKLNGKEGIFPANFVDVV